MNNHFLKHGFTEFSPNPQTKFTVSKMQTVRNKPINPVFLAVKPRFSTFSKQEKPRTKSCSGLCFMYILFQSVRFFSESVAGCGSLHQHIQESGSIHIIDNIHILGQKFQRTLVITNSGTVQQIAAYCNVHMHGSIRCGSTCSDGHFLCGSSLHVGTAVRSSFQ